MDTATLILRDALPQDAEALGELGRKAFCAAFEHLYAPADLNAFLQQVYAPVAVAQDIADPAIFHQLATCRESGAMLGFVKLKYPASYEGYSDAANPLVLAQLYTAPNCTSRGIGAALMDWALGFARARDCDAIQLSVWSENTRAQRFYARYGFAKIADIDFYVGNHRDDEFLYELRL